MADMQRTVIVKAKSAAMNGEVMYVYLLVVNSLRMEPLERVLSSKNAPAPLSILMKTAC